MNDFFLFLLIVMMVTIVVQLVKQRSEIRTIRHGLSQLFDQIAQLKSLINDQKNNQTADEEPGTPPEEATGSAVNEEKPQVISAASVEPNPTPTVSAPPPLPLSPSPLTEPAESFDERPSTSHEQLPSESWFTRFKRNNPDLEKFIGENLINKIGIVILVLGISFFVKFAIDKDWINEPARVGIGILCGGILLAVAHRLRTKYKAFSSVLVAGAIAVFYFTIGIAFHDYHLFGQTTAFAIMVGITIFSVFVSTVYDRQELALLSLIGGFAVPFMVSTGQGNYYVLFTYLTILNAGILTVSYLKRWFVVNFVAFVLTIIVFGGWYISEQPIDPIVLQDAMMYASVFYLIFKLAFVINNVLRKKRFTNYEIGAIISNTAAYYGVAYHILSATAPQHLGLFTIVLALFNVIFAFVIYKKYQFDKNIIYVIIGLALTLATITIPVQFEGNYITIFWAAEAVLLFWLTKKSNLRGFTLAGVLVQCLAILSMAMDMAAYGEGSVAYLPFVNKVYLTGIVLVGSLVASYWLFKRNDYHYTLWRIRFDQVVYRKFILALALVFGYILSMVEIGYQVDNAFPNPGTIYGFLYLFHMLYSTALLYFNARRGSHLKLQNIIAVFNIILYILICHQIPLVERQEIIYSKISTFPYALLLHYPAILCLLYQAFIFAKNVFADEKNTTFRTAITPWFLAFFGIFLASAEASVAFLSGANGIEEYYSTHNFVVKVVFPVLWGVLSFLFLIWGIRRNMKVARIIALTLLGLTILKLFLYDIREVSETGKIIAFILLGILILVISFVYQRIKKIIIENHEDHDEPQ